MSTLQNFCIRVIVADFERYYWAFTKCDNIVEQRKFHFLQRVYSDKIVHLLNKEGSVPERYVDFLVNKYTTYLDTDYFQECSWEKVTAKFAEIGSNLKEIHFKKCRKGLSWQVVLCHLYNLEKVIFRHSCNDEILKCIAKFCRNIVTIVVTFSCGVTDKGMKYLCMEENGVISCPKLEELCIKYSCVTLEGVVHLVKNLRSLETIDRIDLPNALYSIHENDLSALHKIEPYKFTSLRLTPFYSLHNNYLPPFHNIESYETTSLLLTPLLTNLTNISHYTDFCKICLSLCPRLRSLTCIILEENLDFFPCLNELESLQLECTKNSEVDINNLLKLKTRKLKHLKVHYASLSISALAKSCPSLKHLHLDEVVFQNNSDIPPIFEQLTSCVLGNYDSAAAAQSISLLFRSSPALKRLTLKQCDLSSRELKSAILICFKHSLIEKINLNSCVVEMNFLKDMLRNCHSAARYCLYNCYPDCDKVELHRFAQELPNVPEIMFL